MGRLCDKYMFSQKDKPASALSLHKINCILPSQSLVASTELLWGVHNELW